MESKYVPIETLISTAAKEIADEIQKVVNQRGICSLGLSGGKSPILLYEKMAKLLPQAIIRKLVIFLVDERYTDFKSPDSNYKLVKDHFIFHLISSPKRFIYPLPFLPLEEATAQYQEDLKDFTPFDILILGLGEDGHTASLFPGEEYLNNDGKLIITTPREHANYKRLSLSLSAIIASRKLFFYVPGKNKEEILQKISQNGDSYPAGRVLIRHKHTLLYREKL